MENTFNREYVKVICYHCLELQEIELVTSLKLKGDVASGKLNLTCSCCKKDYIYLIDSSTLERLCNYNYNKHFKLSEKEINKVVHLISNARYDFTAKIFEKLTGKFDQDSIADNDRGRTQLARHLRDAATSCATAEQHISKAWKICEKNMEK